MQIKELVMNIRMSIVAVSMLLVATACDQPPPPPTNADFQAQLESLYLDDALVLPDAQPAHSVSLQLAGTSDTLMEGVLSLDPNTCSLNAFGDPGACTLIAIQGIAVDIRQREIADPSNLNRRFYDVTGEGLPPGLALIVQGRLQQGGLERVYLKLDEQLVPLFGEDGV
jgi:hypothetical protein